MSDTNERSEVLRRIEAGTLTAAEGIQLLTDQRARPGPQLSHADQRWLRIHITNLKTNQPRLNVNVPLRWLEAGWRIGRNFAPGLDEFDWNKVLEPGPDKSALRLLEVEDLADNQRVEIVVE